MADTDFALGYDPSRAAAAKALMRAGRYGVVTVSGVTNPAKSLTKYRRRSLRQGQAGTCWLHAPTQHAEITMNVRGYEGFDVCRRLVGWQGQHYERDRNPADGGSGIDAYRAMAEAGVAHEALCPYTDSRWTLGTRPPAAVWEDAKAIHLTTPVDVRTLDEAVTLIDQDDTPTSLGIWWPYGWDSRQTFMTSIGRGEFGHELLIVGYAKPGTFDGNEWLELDNWHGDLYPVLHPQFAAKVPGYRAFNADNTSDFWVLRPVLETVIGYGNADMSSASDLKGFAVSLPDFSPAFPV